MPRQTRHHATGEAALIGQFILWAGALDTQHTPYLLGPQHVAAIKAAAEALFAHVKKQNAREKKGRP